MPVGQRYLINLNIMNIGGERMGKFDIPPSVLKTS